MRLGAGLAILSVMTVVFTIDRSLWIMFFILAGSSVLADLAWLAPVFVIMSNAVLNEGFAEPLAFIIASDLVGTFPQTVRDCVRGHRGSIF